jgi:uncharacterized protein (DUF433 family)
MISDHSLGGHAMNLPNFLTQDAHGEIFLTGHRIGLLHVVDYHNDGYSAEALHQEFPALPVALIDQVLAFYREHRAEVDAYVDRCHAEMDRNYAAYRPGPGMLEVRRLRERLEWAEARHASDPAWSALPVAEKLRRIEQEDQPEAV